MVEPFPLRFEVARAPIGGDVPSVSRGVPLRFEPYGHL